MSRRKRMETVKAVLDEKAQREAKALAAALRRLTEVQQRLQELEGFRDDYRRQFLGTEGSSISAFRLRDFNAFVARLDEAIARQRVQLERLEQELARQKARWRAEQTRADALEKVLAGYRRDDQRRAERAEQRQHDELSCIRHEHRPSSGDH